MTSKKIPPYLHLIPAYVLGITLPAIFRNQVLWVDLIHVIFPLVVIVRRYRAESRPASAHWPPWFNRLVIANLVVVGLADQLIWFPDIDVDTLSVLRGIAFRFTLLLIPLLGLPWICEFLHRPLAGIPKIGKTVERFFGLRVLYLPILAGLAVVVWQMSDMSFGDGNTSVFLLFLAGLLGLTLWQKASFESLHRDLRIRNLLPHVPGWSFSLFIICLQSDTFDLFRIAVPSETELLLFIVLPIPVWGIIQLQRLHRSPVTAPPRNLHEQAHSIQSRTDLYIDTRGLSDRLTESVTVSDGGVFGITGVRGAGKSALTRHVISRLKGHYFTLEVTSPAIHDQNFGFFTSLCQELCQKVLTDLDPILNGDRRFFEKRLWTIVQRPLLVIMILLAVLSAGPIMVPVQELISAGTLATAKDSGPDLFTRSLDPLLGDSRAMDTLHLVSERELTDILIDQINGILSDKDLETGQKYLLLPSIQNGKSGFWLARQFPDKTEAGIKKRLSDYRIQLNRQFPAFLDPNVFLFQRLGKRVKSDWYSLLGDPRITLPPSEPERATESYLFTKDPGLLGKWRNRIRDLLDDPKLKIYLSHLIHEFRFHLNTPQDTAASDPGLQLVSAMILDAFHRADSRLCFEADRLKKFHEALQVYRQLLDGRVISHPGNGEENAGTGKTRPVLSAFFDSGDKRVLVFWGAMGAILLLLLIKSTGSGLTKLARSLVNRRYLELYAEAEVFLEQLRYHASRETRAGVSWQGLGFGRRQTLNTRDFTLPGLTARYLDFLKHIQKAYNGKLIIGIDELDKVHDPEQVKALLTEIKGALAYPGTFYLISISEDAARSFRRRLASGRDIFESTFDDVIDIDRVDIETAVSILGKREMTVAKAVRLPKSCLEVAAVFGGGIPREIIRARRTLAFARGTPLVKDDRWAAHTLMKEELEKWETHFGETNLSGSDVIKLRQLAVRASGVLQTDRAAGPEAYAAMWQILEPGIRIIDPGDLRLSAGSAGGTPPTETDEDGKTESGYGLIVSDLQMVLRILLLIHSCEWITSSGVSRENYEKALLECHRALADKPALAEIILHELRKSLSAASHETTESD